MTAAIWFIAGLVLVIVAAIVSIELHLRGRLKKHPMLWNMLFYSEQLQRTPNKDVSFRYYGPEARLLAAADFHLNNMGLFSARDYQIERAPDEFRILVLGGEQTASSVVDRSWPDLLQEELSRRDPSRRYTVINLAWPDAGPTHYVDYWKSEGSRFKPDLVIVNYVETDFFRTLLSEGRPWTYRGEPVTGYSRVSYGLAWTTVAAIRGAKPLSLRDENAIPQRPYGFFAPRDFADDRSRVLALQNRLFDEVFGGAYRFHTLTFARQLLSLKRPSVWNIRNFDPPPDRPIDNNAMIAAAAKYFGWLARNVPNLLVVHNFTHGERNVRFGNTEAMLERDPELRVIDMRKFIPAETRDDEMRSWYLESMPEKWSQKGHAFYAGKMADLVLGWQKWQATKDASIVPDFARPD